MNYFDILLFYYTQLTTFYTRIGNLLVKKYIPSYACIFLLQRYFDISE